MEAEDEAARAGAEGAMSTEDRIIVGAIVFGFGAPVVLAVLDALTGLQLPPVYYGMCLGTGIAALVYRFLGGISDVTTVIGGVKLTGVIGALVGTGLLVNSQWERQTEPGAEAFAAFDPPAAQWYAVGRSDGQPFVVRLPATGDSIPPLSAEGLARFDLFIDTSRVRGGEAVVVRGEGPGAAVGRLRLRELAKVGAFNAFGPANELFLSERFVQNTEQDTRLFPFRLRVGRVFVPTEYALVAPENGRVLASGKLSNKASEVQVVDGRHYLVALVEADHNQGEQSWSRFAVVALQPALDE